MTRRRDLVGAWVAVVLFVALTLWLLWGAVMTATSPHPFTPSTWYSGDGDAVEVTP